MSDDPHAPFDKVTLTTPDGQETDVTNVFNGDHEPFDVDGGTEHALAPRLFPESDEERERRESFYSTTPARSNEHVDAYMHTVSVGGSLKLEEKLENLDLVTVTIADADGNVIASGVGEVSVGFKKQVTKDAVIMERGHKAKLR